jgi:hypothetical protein
MLRNILAAALLAVSASGCTADRGGRTASRAAELQAVQEMRKLVQERWWWRLSSMRHDMRIAGPVPLSDHGLIPRLSSAERFGSFSLAWSKVTASKRPLSAGVVDKDKARLSGTHEGADIQRFRAVS